MPEKFERHLISLPDNSTNGKLTMNKQGLIDAISAETKIQKNIVSRVLDAFVSLVKEHIANGEKVKIAGFGTFQLTQAAERLGRNPKTGEVIQIAATVRPRFVASPLFKVRVDKGQNPEEER